MAIKKPTTQKQTPTKTSLSENLKKKWWAVLLLAIFVLAVGTFAYNKYLDHKNVQDMKALLADFQQLEKDMEKETGEEFTIEADCSSVGKFATSYSCNLSLEPTSKVVTEEVAKLFDMTSFVYNSTECGRFSSIGYRVVLAKDYFSCRALHVRASNEVKAEQIFYEYDNSPESP